MNLIRFNYNDYYLASEVIDTFKEQFSKKVQKNPRSILEVRKNDISQDDYTFVTKINDTYCQSHEGNFKAKLLLTKKWVESHFQSQVEEEVRTEYEEYSPDIEVMKLVRQLEREQEMRKILEMKYEFELEKNKNLLEKIQLMEKIHNLELEKFRKEK